jgi:23S rRNA pseudouridine2457 synthase
MSELQYILFNKPYGVLSQFTPQAGRRTLSEFGPFPRDVYAAGRLDADSEGVLLLTNDNELTHRLTSPEFNHPRTYLVQIEHVPNEGALERMRRGLVIEGNKTKPAGVRRLTHEPSLPPRGVPIRFRKTVPTAWLEITLYEGRNRQVRKMTAAVGHPTLRIVRTKIGFLSLHGVEVGKSRRLTDGEKVRLRSSVRLPGVSSPHATLRRARRES